MNPRPTGRRAIPETVWVRDRREHIEQSYPERFHPMRLDKDVNHWTGTYSDHVPADVMSSGLAALDAMFGRAS